MKISFIGFGNMAKAIAKGLVSNAALKLQAAAPSLTNGINEQGIRTYTDNLAVLADSDILILAVKPAQMDTVLTQIHSKLHPNTLIISVAAGLSLSWFAKHAPHSPIVRSMPNIAAAVGKAATPLIANQFVTHEQKQWAQHMFTSLGLITWVNKESDIDTYTALSGSGPAYIFMFMEAMMKAAITMGIPDDIAQSFTLQTFSGALNLATESNLTIAELRATVTSPKGTTAAAIEVFTQHGFDEIILEAMQAACKRAKEM